MLLFFLYLYFFGSSWFFFDILVVESLFKGTVIVQFILLLDFKKVWSVSLLMTSRNGLLVISKNGL